MSRSSLLLLFSGAPQSSLLTGLVAGWKLEEASGTRVDATGRGNDLTTTVGSPTSAAGRVGNALSVGGADFVRRTSTADLEIGARDFEICCWINPASLAATNKRFIAKANAANAYLFRVTTTGVLQAIVWSNTVQATAQSGAGAITTGAWFFIDMRFIAASKTWGFSINNGSFTDVATNSGFIDAAATEPLSIGAGNGGGTGTEFFSGLIDEVYFWGRNLTVAERTSLYNAGAGRTYPFVGT